MRLSDLDAARNRTVRGSYVLGVYRWLLGVGFLFVAFNEFPQHKWSIGLGLLVFNAGVEAVGRGIASLAVGLELRLDAGERLSRWATLLAPVRAPHVDLSDRDETAEFWGEMHSRGEGEAKRLREEGEKPVGWLGGFGLATASLLWRIIADLFGIGLAMALTGG